MSYCLDAAQEADVDAKKVQIATLESEITTLESEITTEEAGSNYAITVKNNIVEVVINSQAYQFKNMNDLYDIRRQVIHKKQQQIQKKREQVRTLKREIEDIFNSVIFP